MGVSALTQAQRLELPYIKSIYLVVLSLAGKTLYLSDRDFRYDYTSGVEYYEGYLKDLDDVGEILSSVGGDNNKRISIQFKNEKILSYNYFIEMHEDYSFINVPISIYELRLTSNNEIFATDVKSLLWKGYTEKVRNVTRTGFILDCSSRLFHLRDALGLQKINLTDFPNADPDDVGKYRNKVIGSVEHVPCRAVNAGAVDSLALDITSSATTLYISGTSLISLPTADFTIQIDSEQIRISSRSGTTLTVAASGRGYNSTTASAHNKGAAVAEVLTEYIYEVADHSVKALNNVYVDDIRQWSGAPLTKYTGQAGSELAGYEGRAVIKFTAKPSVTKQVNLNVSTGSHGHSSSSVTTKKLYPSSVTGSNFTSPSLAGDGNENTYAYAHISGGTATLNINFPTTNYGTISTIYFWVRWNGCQIPNEGVSYMRIKKPDNNTMNMTGWPGGTVSWQRYTISGYSSWGGTYKIEIQPGGDLYNFDVYEIYLEIEYTPTIGAHAADGVALSGNSSADTVIGSLVTVDVEGVQDDASGPYTGTANALIERPDHVVKYILLALLAQASGDIGSSFAASGTLFAAAISGGYKFGFIVHEVAEKADDLLQKLSQQCRSDFFDWHGKYELVFCPDTYPDTMDMIFGNAEFLGEPTFELSDAVDVKNDLRGYYRRNYRKSGELGDRYMDMLKIPARNGAIPEDIELTAIRLSAMAENVLEWMLRQKEKVLKSITLTANWIATDLAPAQFFSITDGLYAGKQFKLTAAKINRKNRSVTIQGADLVKNTGNDSYTVLLLHCSGADGSTAIIDSSEAGNGGQGHSPVAYGGACLKTDQYYFAPSSLRINAADSGNIKINDHPDFDLPGDFRLDCKVRFVSLPDITNTDAFFIQVMDALAEGIWAFFLRNYSGTLKLAFSSYQASTWQEITDAWTPSLDTWYDVCVLRKSGTVKFAINGAQVGVDHAGYNYDLTDAGTSKLVVGSGNGRNYYIQEIRITNGKARSLPPFTPPSDPYGN